MSCLHIDIKLPNFIHTTLLQCSSRGRCDPNHHQSRRINQPKRIKIVRKQDQSSSKLWSKSGRTNLYFYLCWWLRNLIDEVKTIQKSSTNPTNTITQSPNWSCLKPKYSYTKSWTLAIFPVDVVIFVVTSPNWDAIRPCRVHATGLM